MIAKLLQKWGITISHQQEKLLKLTLLFIVISLPYWLLIHSPAEGSINYINFSWLGTGSDIYYYGDPLSRPVLVALAVQTILVIVTAVLVGVGFIVYIGKLCFKSGFRESEMTESVNFAETDEREQLETMRATRRAYMVVNFALLISWLVFLITLHMREAFLLFFIQVIGAVSFRNNTRLLKRTRPLSKLT